MYCSGQTSKEELDVLFVKKFIKSLQLCATPVYSYSLSLITVSSCLIFISQGFRIDLTCKQLTVDFVNQSVLQISSQDVEGKRSDKTDFAEKLGAMNRRWQILQGLIAEKVMVQLKCGQELDLKCFILFF